MHLKQAYYIVFKIPINIYKSKSISFDYIQFRYNLHAFNGTVLIIQFIIFDYLFDIF